MLWTYAHEVEMLKLCLKAYIIQTFVIASSREFRYIPNSVCWEKDMNVNLVEYRGAYLMLKCEVIKYHLVPLSEQ